MQSLGLTLKGSEYLQILLLIHGSRLNMPSLINGYCAYFSYPVPFMNRSLHIHYSYSSVLGLQFVIA